MSYFRYHYYLIHHLTYSFVHINTFVISFSFSSLSSRFFHTLKICSSHSRCITCIPIPIPIMSHMAIPILMGFPWDFYSVGFPTPMHSSNHNPSPPRYGPTHVVSLKLELRSRVRDIPRRLRGCLVCYSFPRKAIQRRNTSRPHRG